MTIIRKAKKEDIPRLMELLVQVDMVHHRGRPDLFKGPATKYSADELEDILERDDVAVFVSTDGNNYVTGHAFCVHRQINDDSVLTDIKSLYIDDICVDENSRGRGVGRDLYVHALKYAKENDFYNITLNVYTCNPNAVQFYESLGLKPFKIGMEQIL